MFYCYSVCSDLDTEEGRDRFSHDIVEVMFNRVWADDKMMRRQAAVRELPEEAGKRSARVQKVLAYECRNKDWHPGNVVSYSWGEFRKGYYPNKVPTYRDAVRLVFSPFDVT